MESTKTRKPKGIIRAVSLVTVVCTVLFVWTCKGLHKTSLSSFVRSDLPMLDLNLKFLDIDGEEIPPQETRLMRNSEAAKSKPAASTDVCPEIIGGDTEDGSGVKAEDSFGEHCPKTATWLVKRRAISSSLYFHEPRKVLSLFQESGPVGEFWQSKFIQGLLHEPLHSAGIRAEDLGLEGVEGAFLQKLILEALEAHGELHYDVTHGRKGFVFSFVRDECPYASKALPVIARTLARSGYRVPELREPVLEMRIGLQRVFLTEYQERVYLSNGLEALLNVMESIRPPVNDPPTTPLVLTLRAEAFLDKLLPVMVGGPGFDLNLGLGLYRETPGFLRFDAGKFAKHLRPKVFKGVPAGIPHDIFAALVTSFHLPSNMTIQEWQQLAMEGPSEQAASGPGEGGFAILWDLSSEMDQITNLGVVIANQTSPDDFAKFKSYFADPKLTAECGGGTVFLAATSRTLLTRMHEACERQSLSVLDWERGSRAGEYASSQLFLLMNPGMGMRELFLAGGAKGSDNGDLQPQWKQRIEKAKELMRKDGETAFGSLPVLGYSGNVDPAVREVHLKGFTVKQGASQ